jgi:hypothetical protein
MILPTKHTSFEQSFIGFGGYILRIIDNGLTIDELWKQCQRDLSNGKYAAKQSLDNLLLTLAFLFSIGAINDDNGKIMKCS